MKNTLLLGLLILMLSVFSALGQGSSIVYPPITSSQVATLVEEAIQAGELQLEYAITNININYPPGTIP